MDNDDFDICKGNRTVQLNTLSENLTTHGNSCTTVVVWAIPIGPLLVGMHADSTTLA